MKYIGAKSKSIVAGTEAADGSTANMMTNAKLPFFIEENITKSGLSYLFLIEKKISVGMTIATMKDIMTRMKSPGMFETSENMLLLIATVA